MDAYARLFCVRVNNAPDMATYFIDKPDLDDANMNSLLEDEAKRGFINTIIAGSPSIITQRYYSVGDKMFALRDKV